MTRPFVSVVTVNYNGGELLEPFLDSVAAQDLGPDDIELIVVDNGSTDGSLELLARLPVGACPRPGQEPGLLAGRERRRADPRRPQRVALLNNDMRVEPDWLSELVRAYDPEAWCRLRRRPDPVVGRRAPRLRRRLVELLRHGVPGRLQPPAGHGARRATGPTSSSRAAGRWWSHGQVYLNSGGFDDDLLRLPRGRGLRLAPLGARLPGGLLPEDAVGGCYHLHNGIVPSLRAAHRRLVPAGAECARHDCEELRGRDAGPGLARGAPARREAIRAPFRVRARGLPLSSKNERPRPAPTADPSAWERVRLGPSPPRDDRGSVGRLSAKQAAIRPLSAPGRGATGAADARRPVAPVAGTRPCREAGGPRNDRCDRGSGGRVARCFFEKRHRVQAARRRRDRCSWVRLARPFASSAWPGGAQGARFTRRLWSRSSARSVCGSTSPPPPNPRAPTASRDG